MPAILSLEYLVPALAATSVTAAILLLFWPYTVRDRISERLAAIANEENRIRTRERARLFGGRRTTLGIDAKPLARLIFEKFNLSGQADDTKLVMTLRQAGYRGRAPVITFLAARVVAPFLSFAGAAVYLFLLLRPDLTFLAQWTIAVGTGVLSYYAPSVFLQNRIAKRQLAIGRAWPDALDLLLICVQSGMSLDSAIRKVADEISMQSIDTAEELSVTSAELSYLPDRRQAFENLGTRTGIDAVKAMVTSLIQAEKYGTPMSQALRVLAQESRDARFSEAEKKAASLPPKLTVPMILFFLPVLFAVILTPAIIQYMRM